MEEKRQINSEAELVNALCKGVGVEGQRYDGGSWEIFTMFDFLYEFENPEDIENAIKLGCFRYSEPVEVVELWGDGYFFTDLRIDTDPEKITKIIQNNKIIWTETEEL